MSSGLGSGYWHGKRVAVIGGAGFVGRHLVRLLADSQADVMVLDNFSRGTSNEAVIAPNVRYQRGDATEMFVCLREVAGCDAVFNLAAHVAGVEYNQSHQLEMWQRNSQLQTVPVWAAERGHVQRFLQVSSVCIYGQQHNCPSVEEHGWDSEPTIANAGYSWAKRMGEKVVEWSSLPFVVTVRPSNIFGVGDYYDEQAHVIPALIRKIAENEVVLVNGTGNEEREFIYVEDVARGMMAAVEHGRHGEIYNLGTNGLTCVSIRALVDMLQNILGVSKVVEYVHAFDPGDHKRYSDAGKANRELGWRAEVSLYDGLVRTVENYAHRYRHQRQKPVVAQTYGVPVQ